jgi:hypothetical protein
VDSAALLELAIEESYNVHDGSNVLHALAQNGDPALAEFGEVLTDRSYLSTVSAFRSYDGSTPLW